MRQIYYKNMNVFLFILLYLFWACKKLFVATQSASILVHLLFHMTQAFKDQLWRIQFHIHYYMFSRFLPRHTKCSLLGDLNMLIFFYSALYFLCIGHCYLWFQWARKAVAVQNVSTRSSVQSAGVAPSIHWALRGVWHPIKKKCQNTITGGTGGSGVQKEWRKGQWCRVSTGITFFQVIS